MQLKDFVKGKSPIEMLYHWAEQTPDAIYLRQPVDGQWLQYSWANIDDQVRRLASALKSLGLEQGDKVAILSKNCAEWIISDLALQLSGLVSVPLYVDQTPESLAYVLEHSEAKAIFVGKLDEPVWQRLRPSIAKTLITIGFSYHGSDCDFVRTQDVQHQLPDLVATHQPMTGKPIPDDEDVWTIIYTSGTTGNPKGVVHCYRAPRHVGHHAVAVFNLSARDRSLSFLPLAHVAERLLLANSSLYSGMQINFTQSLKTFQHDLCAVRPTIFFSVPRLWKKFQDNILARIPQSRLDTLLAIPLLRSLVARKVRNALGLDQARMIVSGAAALSPALQEWYACIGLQISEGYGMTENFAYGFIGRSGAFRPGTVGKAMPENGAKLSAEGEILFKSPTLMQGYYKEPEKTQEALDAEGYYRTGDLGQLDSDGFLRITGRIKELFKTEKGEYVAPSPIEAKLSAFKGFEQICLIGSGMPQPVAIVTLTEAYRPNNEGDLRQTITDFVEQTNRQLLNHEKIAGVVIATRDWSPDSGLVTPTLKVKRNLIEAQYSELAEQLNRSQAHVLWERA
jgi:long-chain acyl-CoA synthetase